MRDPLLAEKKKKNLLVSIWEGVFAAITTGCGETYMPPFAIALGAGNLQVGLLTSLPILISSLVQLKTPDVAHALGSRRKFINTFISFQILIWIPLLCIPFFFMPEHRVPLLIAFYTVYITFGAFAMPAWGSLMSDSVAEEARGKYFGKRGMIVGAVTVFSSFFAGFILNWFSARVFTGFAVIFLTAAAARVVSNYFMGRLYDPESVASREHCFSFWDFLRRLPASNFAKYAFYTALFNFSAYMAGPYFAVLMLRNFGFSYLTYSILITAASVASLLGLTYWGRHADEFGNARLFKISSILITLLPLLWIISHKVWYLFVVQLIAGYLWGGFNLCTANFIYDVAIPQKRVYCISYFNVMNGTGIFLGTVLGGYLSLCMPPLLGYKIFPLLVISAGCRMLVALFLLPRVKEVRAVKAITKRDLLLKMTGFHFLTDITGSR